MLDIALVLRLVNKLSGPIKQPTGDVRQFGNMALEAQENLQRFGLENADIQKLGKLKQASELAGLGISGLSTRAEVSSDEISKLRGDIEHFRSLKQEVGATGTQLEEAQVKAATLARKLSAARAVDGNGAEVRRLEREFDGATAAARRLKETHLSQRRTLDLVRGSLRGAGVDTRDLIAATRELNRRDREHIETMRQRERITGRLANQRGRLGRLQESAERYQTRRSQMRGAAMETGALAYGGYRFIQGAGQGQSRLTEIGITGEMSLEERKELHERISEIRKSVVGSRREELLSAMSTLTASGIAADVSQRALEPMARTAVGGFSTLPDVAKSTIALNQNLGIPIEKLQKALDMQAKGGLIGAFELKDMAVEFPAITAIAAGQGIQGEEGLASLIAAAQVARPAAANSSSAATLLTNLLGKIDAPDTVRNFEKFDIDLIERLQEFDIGGINRLEAITKLTMEARDGGARVSELFGDRETKRMMDQMLSGWERYKDFKQTVLHESSGTVAASYKDRTQNDPTLGWTSFNEDAKDIRDKFALPMLPAVSQGMQSFGPVLEQVGSWAAANPETITTLTQAAMALGALRIATLGVGFAFNTLAGPVFAARRGLLLFGIANSSMKLRILSGLPVLGRLAYGFGFLGGRALLSASRLSRLGAVFSSVAGLAPLRWASKIVPLRWTRFIKPIGWSTSARKLSWRMLIPKLSWLTMLPKLSWRLLITPLKWTTRLIPIIGWASILLPLLWDYVIKPLGWDKYLPSVDWTRFLDAIDWKGRWIPKVDWSQMIDAISWPDWMTKIEWLNLLGGLLWPQLIKPIEWGTWLGFEWKSLLPKWDWSAIIPPLSGFSLSEIFSSKTDEKPETPVGSKPLALKLAVPAIDGARRLGGPVRAGGTYLVGEEGPELLTVGRNSGFVIPSALSMAMLSAAPAAAAPLIADAGGAIQIAHSAPLPSRTSSSRAQSSARSVKIELRVEAGAIVVQGAPNQDPAQIGQAALQALVDQATPLLERALSSSDSSDAEMHDASELFDE